VVNALRVAICPYQPADCDRYCPRRDSQRPCDGIAGVQDRDLFWHILAPGERSALFSSRSSIVRNCYGEHQVCFFYIRLEEEVSRVELPRWAVGEVGLAHALLIEQARLGHGYPVALMEAHEKAVIGAAEREQFWQLVSLSLAESHLPETTSGKSRSKRRRWI
jgi:hypothetical protein